jgi:glycosyltransferase involved in cell wall biosynthesis
MNILIDGIAFALQKVGGVSRYWLQLIPAMAKDAPDAHFFITLPSRMHGVFPYENVKSLPLRFVVPRRVFEAFDYMRLRRACRKCGADIFHSTYFTFPRGAQVPRIMTVYDMIYEALPEFFPKRIGSRVRRRMKQAIESADAVIAISESTRQEICTYYQIPPERIRVVYPGVSPLFRQIADSQALEEFRKRLNIHGEFLLYLGKRGGYKNFVTLLAALAQVKSKDGLTLLCVGGEKGLDKVHTEQARKLGILTLVRWVENLREEDLVLAYNCAAALIYPSLCEGFGLPVIEAMVCGTPVIASDIPALRESCGDAGLLADPENPSAFANAIDNVLCDKGLRKELVYKGLERAKSFSWERAGRQTLEIYRSLLK